MDIQADISNKAKAPAQERAGARPSKDPEKGSAAVVVQKTTVSVSVSLSVFAQVGFTGVTSDPLVEKLAKGHEEVLARAKNLENQLIENKGLLAQSQLEMIEKLLDAYLLISRLAGGQGNQKAVGILAKQAERLMSLAPDAAKNAQAGLEVEDQPSPKAFAALKELTQRVAMKADLLAFAVEPADGESADGLKRHAGALRNAVTLQAQVSVSASLTVEATSISISA